MQQRRSRFWYLPGNAGAERVFRRDTVAHVPGHQVKAGDILHDTRAVGELAELVGTTAAGQQ